jgi:hypothetical protein
VTRWRFPFHLGYEIVVFHLAPDNKWRPMVKMHPQILKTTPNHPVAHAIDVVLEKYATNKWALF